MAQAEERFKYLGTWHDIMVAAQPNCHDIVERASALQLSCNPLQSVAQRAQTAAPVGVSIIMFFGCWSQEMSAVAVHSGDSGFQWAKTAVVENRFFT